MDKTSNKMAMTLSIRDILLANQKLTTHQCSQLNFNVCENKFQHHVKAVAAFKAEDSSDDKEDLWCQVLSVSV